MGSTLVVHPLNTGRFRHTSDSILSRYAMPTPLAPHEGVTMRVPVGARGNDRLLDCLPGQKLSPLERQRFQNLPPRLDQVQIRRIRRLEDELPARMRQVEEQDIGRFVRRQIIEDRVDPFRRGRDRRFRLVEEVDEVLDRTTRVGGGQCFARGGLEGTKDIAIGGSTLIVQFLFAPACERAESGPISSRQTTTLSAGAAV